MASLAARIFGLLAALSALAGCAVDTCDLDRVGDPIAFGEIRETAAWTPAFDPAWWSEIDAAYAEYDARLARVARESWDPLVSALMDCEQVGFPKDARRARAVWQRHLAVQQALAGAEAALWDGIDRRLPPEADAFVGLLRARAQFWRASSQWAQHGERLAGPLETMGIEGVPVADRALCEAATGAYARLAAVSSAAAARRFEAYLEYCDALVETEAAAAAAAEAGNAAPGAGQASDAVRTLGAGQAAEALGKKLRDHDRRAADERVRVALLAENRAFAAAIDDAARREDSLERTDVLLHQGLRGAAGVRAMRELALRAVARRHPDDAGRRARVEQAFDAYMTAQAPLRARLSSGSAAERKAAYRAILALSKPLYDALSGAIEGVEPLALELMSLAVLLDGGDPDALAEALVSPAVEAEETPEIDEANAKLRNDGLRVLSGFALSPRVVRVLSARLGLSEADAKALEETAAAERSRVAEASKPIVERLSADVDGSLAAGASQGADERVRGLMRTLRTALSALKALDREANARVLAEAARLARVDASDERIEVARLELDLLAISGTGARTREAFGVGGAPFEAAASPFEVVRSMDVGGEVREAAESVVFRRSAELRAAHEELLEQMIRNVEGFLRYGLKRQAEGDRGAKAWYPALAGEDAVALRFELADEIGAALGAPAREAYLARLRAVTQPGMEPERDRAVARLAAFAAARDAAGESDARRDARALIGLLLATADADRAKALRALHAWRASWVRASELESPDAWKAVARRSAEGAVLRARVQDVDGRCIARCEAVIAEGFGVDAARAAVGRFAQRIPARFAPYFAD
ncbi:MAG: hypothetical protein ACKOYN_13225 [Planctomycetota bacterium]